MRVRFTLPAQADLDGIYAYISRDNPQAASRLVAQLIERARALGDTPYEGRATDEPNARVLTIPRLFHLLHDRRR
jgi:plasmid stabilization system protein ParE